MSCVGHATTTTTTTVMIVLVNTATTALTFTLAGLMTTTRVCNLVEDVRGAEFDWCCHSSLPLPITAHTYAAMPTIISTTTACPTPLTEQMLKRITTTTSYATLLHDVHWFASAAAATKAAATYGLAASNDIQSRAVKRRDVEHQSFELH